MKKNYKLLSIFIVATLLSSCISTNKLTDSTAVESPGSVTVLPLEADITVDDTKKIKGNSKSTYFLMFRIEGDNEYADGVNYRAMSLKSGGGIISRLLSALNPFKIINKIMTGDAQGKVLSAAAYDAMSGSDADFIAHPTYSYTRKNYIIVQQFEATVEGYAGFYSNFRSFDPEKRRLENNLDRAVNEIIIEKLVIGDGLNK